MDSQSKPWGALRLRAVQEIHSFFLDLPPVLRRGLCVAWQVLRFVLKIRFAVFWLFAKLRRLLHAAVMCVPLAARRGIARVWKIFCRFCVPIPSPRERAWFVRIARGLGAAGIRPATSPVVREWLRLAKAASGSLAAVAAIFVFHALEGEWTWLQNFGRHFASQIAVEFLPIPFTFMLWMRIMERKKKFQLSFSPLLCAFSVGCFVTAQEMARDYNIQQELFAAGVIGALFIAVPLHAALRRMVLSPRVTACAIVGGAAVCNYYYLMRTMWERMCAWTADLAFTILHPYSKAIVTFITPGQHNFLIQSQFFSIQVNPGCNGLEGIFLFNFLLSVMLLLDWELFKRRSIIFLYVLGVGYMFVFNALRIVAFFTLGYWAYNPYAWPVMWRFQGWPVYLFHSYIGWLFYLFAFGIFAGWMYTSARRETLGEKIRRLVAFLWRMLAKAGRFFWKLRPRLPRRRKR